MARQLAAVAGEPHGLKARMIAKIERAEAIRRRAEEILQASDGIMVARGDLAVEVGNAAVPALQKRMIRLAREANKLTITATQMMETHDRRTRCRPAPRCPTWPTRCWTAPTR